MQACSIKHFSHIRTGLLHRRSAYTGAINLIAEARPLTELWQSVVLRLIKDALGLGGCEGKDRDQARWVLRDNPERQVQWLIHQCGWSPAYAELLLDWARAAAARGWKLSAEDVVRLERTGVTFTHARGMEKITEAVPCIELRARVG
jgi:hypothetical protein